MPVSIIVGGQYGSEGKGKVSLEIARKYGSQIIAVRVGGPNSGHIAYDRQGRKRVFRQIPVCAADGASLIVLPVGTYLDVPLLLEEAQELGIQPNKLIIDPHATIITDDHREWETGSGIVKGIGSTGSGTGAAVMANILGNRSNLGIPRIKAKDIPELQPYIADTSLIMREKLNENARIVVEGTQGYGLSLNHGPWPHVTSRDTTAAAVIAECGLSPLDVDDVTMVIRCHPIRVAGQSGPLHEEIDWQTIAEEAGADKDITEMTTVTGKVRRVGSFDENLVRNAIMANGPNRIVLNHLDYIDWGVRSGEITPKAKAFIENIEKKIGRKIDWLGINEKSFIFQ